MSYYTITVCSKNKNARPTRTLTRRLLEVGPHSLTPASASPVAAPGEPTHSFRGSNPEQPPRALPVQSIFVQVVPRPTLFGFTRFTRITSSGAIARCSVARCCPSPANYRFDRLENPRRPPCKRSWCISSGAGATLDITTSVNSIASELRNGQDEGGQEGRAVAGKGAPQVLTRCLGEG